MRTYLLLACAALASSAGAQLYDNGQWITGPTTQVGDSAPSGAQWSECSFVGGEQMGTAGFSASRDGGYRLADDFTLASAAAVGQLHLYAYQTNSGTDPTINFGTLQIWNGRPGDSGAAVIFGDTITNRLANATFTNVYRIFSTAGGFTADTARPVFDIALDINMNLDAGSYWLDWSLGGDVAYSGPWNVPVTIPGQLQKAGSNARQWSGSGWNDTVDGLTGYSQDMAFSLSPVPEPTSIAVLSVGALALLRRRLRR